MKINLKYLEWFRRYRRRCAWDEQPSIYVLEPDEFDRVVHDLQNPGEPTESIKRGAELLRTMYPRS